MEDYRIYRGARGDGSVTFDRFFFYHIPKTAGTSIYMAMRATGTTFFRQVRQALPDYPLTQFIRVDVPFDQIPPGIDFGFVASHLPWGIHKKFPGSYQLMTLLRDPVQRSQSAYLYNAMRNNLPISEKGFVDHFERTANQDFMAKHLGFEHEPVETIISRMEERFSLIDVDQRADRTIENLLQRNSLPNVIMRKFNQSSGSGQINLEEHASTIYDLNPRDLDLFKHFAARGQTPPPLERSAPHPVTILIYEARGTEKSAARILMSDIDIVREFGDQTTITEAEFIHLADHAVDITQMVKDLNEN